MRARRPASGEAVTSQVLPTCAACELNALGWCRVALGARHDHAPVEAAQIDQSSRTVPARRIIFWEQELHDAVPVICSGWAASAVTLPNGGRQILSFLLPGDLVSTALLFESRSHGVVEAITEVRVRSFKRSELKPALLKRADLFEKFGKAWVEEKRQAEQLIADLGQRAADERIAHLIMNLANRLASRGMLTTIAPTSAMEMDFPLRQRHIADATGVTPVDVSKVLSEFRRNELIKVGDRTLTILDPVGLRRAAHAR
jgi:CRP/FNR family transcriptional regulator, anaerobic regulatory protein